MIKQVREIEKRICVKFCFSVDLPEQDKLLLECAINAREKAQAPYSHYKVGAAVATYDEGATKIYSGCNVERSTYTQSTHAEQNAIDTMIATHGTKKVLKICIVGGPDSDSRGPGGRFLFAPKYSSSELDRFFPISFEQVPVPCGHCLQIIWENCFSDPDVELISVIKEGLIAITTIGSAFPMRFGPKDLGIEYK